MLRLPPPEPADAAWIAILDRCLGHPFGDLPIRGAAQARLVASVKAMSRFYNGLDRAPPPPHEALLARAYFWFLRDLPKPVQPLREALALSAIPSRRLRILDLGAGLGASTAGALLALAPSHSVASVDLVDVDSTALASASRILAAAAKEGLLPGPAPEVRPINASFAEEHSLARAARGPYDLILGVNAFVETLKSAEPSEEQRGALLAGRLARFLSPSWLAPDGLFLVVEPATRAEARVLQVARRHLLGASHRVIAPCPHEGLCPMLTRERDWCHADHDTELAEPVAEIARAAGLHFQGLSYAYLLLAPLTHLTSRIASADGAVPARLVSAPRDLKGRTEAFVCGAFGPVTGFRALQLDRDAKKARGPALADLSRGDIVEIRATVPAGSEPGAVVRLMADGLHP